MSLAEALRAATERVIGFAFTGDEIERRLVPLATARAAALRLASPRSYVELLEAQPVTGPEWARVIGLVTNGQTSLFRDPEQLAALAWLLEGIARRRERVHVWSAGCSTGEEPYTVAILAHELGIAERTSILATDINQGSLARAREARYSPWALRKVGPERTERWFEQEGGTHRARPALRGLVELRVHNLVGDEPARAPGGWDVILCRNVLLYFSRAQVADAGRRLAAALAPDGWLALSACESLRGLVAELAPEMIHGRVFYRRGPLRAAGPAPAAPARRGHIDRGPPALAAAPAATPRPVQDAIELARRGRVQDALGALIARPDGGILHHLTCGHLHLRLHEVDEALAAYRRAAAIDSLLCEVHYFEGIAHRKAGAWQDAAQALRRALFLAPSFWQAAYLLAGAHDRLGLPRDAARDRAHARRVLAERPAAVAFLSDPLFVDWLSVDEATARRLLGVP